uniref:Uncharacterized protein n=1 Tax=Vitis vinifera TaxID=29760 RepID=F6GXG1_VITVI
MNTLVLIRPNGVLTFLKRIHSKMVIA